MKRAAAFGLLALVAELGGRSLTHRIDLGRHVSTPGYAGSEYYPALMVAVKLGLALLLARLMWRFLRARAAARAGRRVLAAVGEHTPVRPPGIRLSLSPRLWLCFFAVTAGIYLVQTDVEQLATGRWPLLAPWLHSSALPVFAVLSVALAFVWGVVAAWFADYESYAEETLARAFGIVSAPAVVTPRAAPASLAPRLLFGLSFESRPPPLPA